MFLSSFFLSLLNMFQKSILVMGLQKDEKKSLQSITRPMLDGSSSLLYSTFPPQTSTHDIADDDKTLTPAQAHMPRMFSIWWLPHLCQLYQGNVHSQHYPSSLASNKQMCFGSNPFVFCPLSPLLNSFFFSSENSCIITARVPVMEFSG